MKRSIVKICLCMLVLLNCSEKPMAEEQLNYVQVYLSERHIHYNEVMSKYKELWIGYTTSNETVVTTVQDEVLIINKVYYFYRENNEYILMGSVDKTGLYNKDGNKLKDVSNVSSTILGISSAIIKYPFGPSFVLQSKSNPEEFYETDSFATLDFDMVNNSIRLMDMSIFLQ